MQRHPDTTAELFRAGHVIGNHSYSHRFSTYLVPGRFDREVRHTQAVLTNLLGETPALARAPWLWRTPSVLTRWFQTRTLVPFAIYGLLAGAGSLVWLTLFR